MSTPEDSSTAHPLSDETAVKPAEARVDPTVAQGQASALRFTPGTLLAGRYRIVSPLGRGGMGEVYRADDIRLGQPVALKFLAAASSADSSRIERLVDEVRVGRQISHPNVCRLYDIAEAEGHHFLVMEYVDGEDLASLLRRIGRLPGDKALDIARGVCAGLAAAHDKGIIHRDLKPANVMVDGRGHARIADFGLAALAYEGAIADMSGTPQYMAPEQLTGGAASLRSDVYALGLLLHEMLTGKRVFEAKSLNELRALHAESKAPSLSSSATDVDPGLERVVLRCLARDPNDRPASARVVLLSLPGGDPLEAALLAGETPSPEMVAAAAVPGDLSVRAAWLWLGAALLGLWAVCSLSGQAMLHGLTPLPKAPEVLLDRARTILERQAKGERMSDSAWGLEVDRDYLLWIADKSPSRQQLAVERPGPIALWYRASPEPLVARTWVPDWPWVLGARLTGRVTRFQPPPTVPGMSEVVLDMNGRLLRWAQVAGQNNSIGPDPQATLARLFEEAGLTAGNLRPGTSRHPERLRVWRGEFPDSQGRVRVEAAMEGLWVASFEVIRDEVHAEASLAKFVEREVQGRLLRDVVLLGIPAWVGIALLVIRNLRLKRGDRRGANAILVFGVVTGGAALKLKTHFPSSLYDAFDLWMASDAQALYWAVLGWIFYIALEPSVRSTWPQMLVSWSRLVSGRVRDPLVGRDVLWGVNAGALLMGLALLSDFLAHKGPVAPTPFTLAVAALISNREALSVLLQWLYPAMLLAASQLLVLITLFRLTRRRWAALLLVGFFELTVIAVGLGADSIGNAGRQFIAAIMIAPLIVAVVYRLGLLSAAVMGYVFLLLLHLPLTTDWAAWYAGGSALGLALVVGLAIYGFIVALAGKAPFGGGALDP